MSCTGMFLTRESENLLREQAITLGMFLDKWVENTHVTFRCGREGEIPKDASKEKVTVVGYACDGKNAGFQVEIPKKLEKYYEGAPVKHITVSLSEDASAKDTGNMSFRPLKPFMVNAEFGTRAF